jgi:hypothetical protein
MIKVLSLLNGQTLIATIEEMPSELGEPDCKLIKPYIIKSPEIPGLSHTLEPWNYEYTSKDEFMIHSDKILTIMDPKPTLIEKYETLIK